MHEDLDFFHDGMGNHTFDPRLAIGLLGGSLYRELSIWRSRTISCGRIGLGMVREDFGFGDGSLSFSFALADHQWVDWSVLPRAVGGAVCFSIEIKL